MRIRTPAFWYTPGRGKLLAPLGHLYGLAGRTVRARISPQRASVPVICVGNLVAGGAGKTPTVMSITDRLVALGYRPHILMRGYGGRLKGPIQADPARHSWQDTGDEALLLSRHAPVWIGADRVASAHTAVAAGANVLVMDDGFQ
ncbi:MAG: tetraacyldisaccharide 4'-kinase, partial [Pseudomonadota bacterium]|nr:tetraacyldisaccharide 4'-kinase [Pseudomonadota bacterium]